MNTTPNIASSHQIAVGDQVMTVQLIYSDGSSIELRMPLPDNAAQNTEEQLQQLARRMAGRLLTVAIEDLEEARGK